MSSKSIAIPKARPSTSGLFDRSPKDASYSSWSSACSNASTSCISSPARSQRRGSLLSESAPSRDVTAARDSLEQLVAKNALEFLQYKILTVTGTSLAKEQSTVINIGEPEGPPRLVSPTLQSWRQKRACQHCNSRQCCNEPAASHTNSVRR